MLTYSPLQKRVLLLAFCLIPTVAYATPPEVFQKHSHVDIATKHEIWYVSTREISQYDHLAEDLSKIEYHQLVDGKWTQQTARQFDSRQGIDTSFLIHGSPAAVPLVLEVTLDVYKHMRPMITDDRPFRYVIWSWPADRQLSSIKKEFRDQAVRAQPQAFYLADVIDRCRQHNQTLLVGYSMGARVSAGALHLLGGGVNPYTPQLKTRTNNKVAYLAIAGAIDRDWLEPDNYYGKALSVTTRFLNVYNTSDPLLKRYNKLYPKKRGAVGAIGLNGVASKQALNKIGSAVHEMNVTSVAGKTHDIRYITGNSNLLHKIWDQSFATPGKPQ